MLLTLKMRFILLQLVVYTLFMATKAGVHHPGIPLSEYLWSKTLREQEAALNSTLIRGFVSTKLNPTSFGIVFFLERHLEFKLVGLNLISVYIISLKL